MGKKGSKLPNAPTFDHVKSVQKLVGIRKKNIPHDFRHRSPPVEDTTRISNEKSSIHLVENMILVWLDSTSDKSTDANQKTLQQFRRVINIVRPFSDIEPCFDFLNSIQTEKILFIVSGSFGPQIVPRIDNFNQIYSIYIFCGNKSNHIEWSKPFKKVHGIHTQSKDLCEALRYDNNQYDKGLTAISILPPSPVLNLNSLNKQFIYLQVMKSILLEIEYDRKMQGELIEYVRPFYAGNLQQGNIIETFDASYSLHSPIWWYSRKCFTYHMLRCAFAQQNFQVIYKLAFYIRDLHREIKKAYLQIHSHQYHAVNLFRAARMTHAEFDNLERNQNGLLSFNDFLVATLERVIALKFAQKLRNDPNITAVIYKLDVDPSKSSIPFVALNNLTYLSGTNGEILLSMNTIFHIDSIEKISDRIYEITLSPASKKDEQIANLVSYMQEITCGLPGWYKLSKIMMEVEEYDQVEHIYKSIYDQTVENQLAERAFVLHELGYVYDLKNDPSTSISYYRRALEIYLGYLPAVHPTLLPTYINLASALKKQDNLNEALLQYEEALKVEKSDDPMVIAQYNNIGAIRQQQGKYSEAQQAYLKASEVLISDFPSARQILADTYYNLAGLFYSIADYRQALVYYEKVLAIEEILLPPNPSSLATLYFNLATAYAGVKDWKKAIECAEKSVETARQAFGDNHQEVQENLAYVAQLQTVNL